MFVALTQCAASVYQMMRGIIVVITAAMSILFLGAKQYTHHWIALFMIVAGVAIVGVVSVALGKKDDAADSTSFNKNIYNVLDQVDGNKTDVFTAIPPATTYITDTVGTVTFATVTNTES